MPLTSADDMNSRGRLCCARRWIISLPTLFIVNRNYDAAIFDHILGDKNKQFTLLHFFFCFFNNNLYSYSIVSYTREMYNIMKRVLKINAVGKLWQKNMLLVYFIPENFSPH